MRLCLGPRRDGHDEGPQVLSMPVAPVLANDAGVEHLRRTRLCKGGRPRRHIGENPSISEERTHVAPPTPEAAQKCARDCGAA